MFHLEQKQRFRIVAQRLHEWGNSILARLLQQEKSTAFIAKIKTSGDTLVYNTSDIAREFCSLYQQLYHVQPTVTDPDLRRSLIQEYLAQANLPKLSTDALEALEGEFTASELRVALKAMANGKAPAQTASQLLIIVPLQTL